MSTQWLLGYSTGSNTAAARFGPVTGNANNGGQYDSTEATSQIPWAAAGKFKRAKVFLATAPGSVKSWRFQLSVNGTPSTAIDLTIADLSTSGTVTADVTIAAGDLVAWKVTPTGTPAANAHFEVWLEWEPTTTDQFVYGAVFGLGSAISVGAQFNPLFHGFAQTTLTTENNAKSVSPAPIAGQITAFYVRLDAAPTSTHSWDFSLRVNGADVGSLLNIAGVNTTGNQTGLSQAVAVLDRLTFHVVNRNGTPTNTRVAYSVIFVPTSSAQFCLTGGDEVSNSTGIFWMPVGGNAGHDSENSTEATVQVHAPSNLDIKSIVYRLTTAPGAQKSWAVTSRIGGAPGNLTITAGNAATGSDTGHTDSLNSGDLIDISCAVTGAGTGPTAMGTHCWGMGFAPTTGDVYQAYRSIQRELDPADWDGTVDVILEVHGKTSIAGDPLKARLYNVTDAAAVTGSDISSAATAVTRVRSGTFSLATGTKVYEVQYGGAVGASYTLEDAVLIDDVTP